MASAGASAAANRPDSPISGHSAWWQSTVDGGEEPELAGVLEREGGSFGVKRFRPEFFAASLSAKNVSENERENP